MIRHVLLKHLKSRQVSAKITIRIYRMIKKIKKRKKKKKGEKK